MVVKILVYKTGYNKCWGDTYGVAPTFIFGIKVI